MDSHFLQLRHFFLHKNSTRLREDNKKYKITKRIILALSRTATIQERAHLPGMCKILTKSLVSNTSCISCSCYQSVAASQRNIASSSIFPVPDTRLLLACCFSKKQCYQLSISGACYRSLAASLRNIATSSVFPVPVTSLLPLL